MGPRFDRLKSQAVPFLGGLLVGGIFNGTIAFKAFGLQVLLVTILGPLTHPVFNGVIVANMRYFISAFVTVIVPIGFLLFTLSRDGERRPFIAGLFWALAGGAGSGLVAAAVRTGNFGIG